MPLPERTPEEVATILAKYRKGFTPEDLIEHADFDGQFVPLDDVVAIAEAMLREAGQPVGDPETAHVDNPHDHQFGATGSAQAAFLNALARAVSAGAGTAEGRAMREVHERLRIDPHGFGELMYHLRQLRTQIRHAVIGPFYVEFGVYDVERMTVVSCVCWLADPAG